MLKVVLALSVVAAPLTTVRPFEQPVPPPAGTCKPREPDKSRSIPKKAGPDASWLYTGGPPPRFQGDTSATVEFHSKEEVNRICAGGVPICGVVFYACHFADQNRIVMPNPCQYSQDEGYARTLCHEMGHVNGWPWFHGY